MLVRVQMGIPTLLTAGQYVISIVGLAWLSQEEAFTCYEERPDLVNMQVPRPCSTFGILFVMHEWMNECKRVAFHVRPPLSVSMRAALSSLSCRYTLPCRAHLCSRLCLLSVLLRCLVCPFVIVLCLGSASPMLFIPYSCLLSCAIISPRLTKAPSLFPLCSWDTRSLPCF